MTLLRGTSETGELRDDVAAFFFGVGVKIVQSAQSLCKAHTGEAKIVAEADPFLSMHPRREYIHPTLGSVDFAPPTGDIFAQYFFKRE